MPAAPAVATTIDARSHASRRTGLTPRPIVLGLLASLPLLVGAAVDASHGWLPAGDQARIVLRARDVFSAHMPLVGEFSRISNYSTHTTFEPGPMEYWVLAIPAQVTRWVPWAPLLWMAVVESLVIVAIVWLADRIGGPVLALGSAVGLVVLAYSLGPRALYDPWNAYAPILPFVLLVFLTAGIVGGRHRLLPFAVLAASFDVQSHPSYVIVAAALSVLALGACIVAWRRARAVDWVAVGVTGAVAVACWLPAIVQQLTTSPGNLTQLWRAAQQEGQRQGLAFGLTILAKATAAWPFNRWIYVRLEGGSYVSATWIIAGLLVLAVLASVLVWGLRTRTREVTAFATTAFVLAVGLVGAAATLPNDAQSRTTDWVLIWARAAGMVLWVVVGWSVWRLWGQRVPVRWLVTAGTALLATGAVFVAALGRTPDPSAWSYPVIRRAATVIEQRSGDKPYAVAAALWPYVPLILGQGLIERLDARGYRVGASNGFAHQLGAHYALPSGTPDVIFTSNPDPTSGRSTPPPLLAEPLFAMPVDMWVHGRRAVVRLWLRQPR
jgi:hypothetical protein